MRGLAIALLAGCSFHGTGHLDDVVAPPDEAGVDRDAPDPPGDAPDDAPPFDPFVVRINIAGSAYAGVDYPGAWAADPGAGGICGGSFGPPVAPMAISGTVDDALFTKQVYGLPTLTCAITSIPTGRYAVTLLFGPLYYGSGATPACMFNRSQVFDVLLEGQLVLDDYNLTNETGGCVANGGSTSHPVAKTFMIAITDGVLNISATAPTNEASMLSAVQLVQQAP